MVNCVTMDQDKWNRWKLVRLTFGMSKEVLKSGEVKSQILDFRTFNFGESRTVLCKFSHNEPSKFLFDIVLTDLVKTLPSHTNHGV